MIISDCSNCGDYKYLPIARTCKDCLKSPTIENVTAEARYADGDVPLHDLKTTISDDRITQAYTNELLLTPTVSTNNGVRLIKDGTVSIKGSDKQSVRDEFDALKRELIGAPISLHFTGYEVMNIIGNIDLSAIPNNKIEKALEKEQEFNKKLSSNQSKRVYFTTETSDEEKPPIVTKILQDGTLMISGFQTKQQMNQHADKLIKLIEKNS